MIKNIIDENALLHANSKQLSALHRYFEGCFTADGKFDIECFKEKIREDVTITEEGYGLNFLGKDYSNLIASIDTTTVIEPDIEHNNLPENKDSENIYISGDNLDALKHLLRSYESKVKCIYIDPPYNTGSDGFVYNDNFNFSSEQLQKRLGIDENEADRLMSMTSKGSSSHSAWLMFMSPRLQLARDLLAKDGVIFISIDENEHSDLKLLCDYVFGEENFAGEIIWKNSSKNDEGYVSIQHEYIICYVKDKTENKGLWIEPKEGTDEIFAAFDGFRKKYGNDWKAIHKEALKWYKQFSESNPIYASKHYSWMDDIKGVYFPSDISGPHYDQYRYDVIHPITGKVCKEPASGWRFPKTTMEDNIKSGIIHFGDDETTVPCNKTYLKDTLSQNLTSVIYRDGRVASKKLTSLLGNNCFTNPKDVDVIAKLIKAIGVHDGDIVLDFFSGSATTAESVLQINKQNKNIKFVLVQIQEDLDVSLKRASGSAKTIIQNAINLCDSISKPHNVDEIGQERIRRAAKQIYDENPLFTGDLGFKHYTLREVPENVLEKLEDFNPEETNFANNIMEMFGRDTVLTTWIERDGCGLNAKYDEVKLEDYTAYQCGDYLYLLDEGMSNEAITALIDKYGDDTDWGPHYLVVFGYSFNFGELDSIKKNVTVLQVGEKQIKVNIEVRY